MCSSPGGQKLYYTVSGIITPSLYMFRAHVLIVRRAKIVLYSLWYHHTYRWPSRAQIEIMPPIGVMIPETVYYNFWLPDNEHICSKHVKAWNELIIKFSSSSWLIFGNKKRWAYLIITATVLFGSRCYRPALTPCCRETCQRWQETNH